MDDDVEGPWSKRQTRLLISGAGLFLAGAGLLVFHLLGATTGTERWFWVVVSSLQTIIGADLAGGVIRDRRRSSRPPQTDR